MMEPTFTSNFLVEGNNKIINNWCIHEKRMKLEGYKTPPAEKAHLWRIGGVLVV